MKKLTALHCLMLFLLMCSTTRGWSADFDKGLAAAQKGDYAAAKNVIGPLSWQRFIITGTQSCVLFCQFSGDKSGADGFKDGSAAGEERGSKMLYGYFCSAPEEALHSSKLGESKRHRDDTRLPRSYSRD